MSGIQKNSLHLPLQLCMLVQ
uniref:Uncharacterized protein n=1 Tax=Arundo donax TaxID=35708 RepID=A0A0A8Y1K1_ARUDO